MSVLQNAIAAASGSAGPAAYQVERSLRFNPADSASLTRTPAVAGSKTTWTYSAWFKRSKLGDSSVPVLFGSMYGSVQNRADFPSDDVLEFIAYDGSSFVFNIKTSQIFRDVSAWYHVVLVVDSKNATSSDRIRIYVNGTRVTAFATATYPSQNADCLWNGTNAHQIGSGNGSGYFGGYIAEVNFVDGLALDASYFGEFNASTGVWSPLAYTGSYGNNGFYLPFNDNSTVLNLGRNRQTLTADPYFPYTTLLLNGNGANGAQNNTFLDSSSNNFSITRNGNATQGTFSPFSQTGWSNYFDGASDYLTTPSNAAFGFGTGDFTIEAFVYMRSLPAAGTNRDIVTFSDDRNNCGIDQNGYVYYFDGTGRTTTGNVALNTWNHIAYSRSGGTMSIYLNGVRYYNAADATNQGARVCNIGSNFNNAGGYFDGYISNVRIVKGTALYSGATISVPTAPLTAITNTSLLTCQSNRFFDSSTNALAIARNGDVSVQAFSPFTPTAAYSAATNGGSGYFDGTGDYLTIANNAALFPGTGDFTWEAWVYPTAVSGNNMLWGTGANGLDIYRLSSTGKLVVDQSNVGTIVSSTANVLANTWTHFAVTRSGTTVRLFVNGVLDATATNSANLTNANTVNIGASSGGTNTYTGLIAGNRFLKGTALYTATFTPPTAPPTAIANTQLLLNFTNGGIIDATGKNVLETVGNAQISTAVTKWSGGAIALDGTGDYLPIAPTQNLEFGSGDFTIEFWWRPTSTARQGLFHGSFGADWSIGIDFSSLGTQKIGIWASSNGTTWNLLNADSGGNAAGGTISPTQNAWNHIAFVRQGTTWMSFVNGVRDLNITGVSGSIVSRATYPKVVGAWWSPGSMGQTFGGMADVRVTKGLARYTGNFTPPAAQFAYNQADINVKQWVPTNFSVTAGVGNDSLVDSPTNYGTDTGAGGEVRGNYPTWNNLLGPTPLGCTFSDGNLYCSAPNGDHAHTSMATPTTGKWYWEFTMGSSVLGQGVGIALTTSRARDTNSYYYGAKSTGTTGILCTNGGAGATYGANYAANDVIGVALDLDNQTLTFYKNGVSQGLAVSGVAQNNWDAVIAGGGGQTTAAYINFGQRPFAYTAPSGFKALCTKNIPTPAIGASSTTLAKQQFDVVTYTGNGTTQSITGVSFAPDFVWTKNRSSTYTHCLFDRIRGATKYIQTSNTNAEGTSATTLTSFNSDGFSMGGDVGTNGASPLTYAAWMWKAGGTGVSNTAGTITSTVSANTAAGISIVTYTGNATNSATVGHGLGAIPKLVIIKNRSSIQNWVVIGSLLNSVTSNGVLYLNTTGAIISAPITLTFNSTTFSLTNGADNNGSGNSMVAYCFSEVAGFSKFGSYTGNGSTDGTFVYTGFRPRYIMYKRTDTTGNWIVYDTARSPYNQPGAALYPNLTNAEDTSHPSDILSNGFKLRSTGADSNASGGTYIYMAFAEAPFQYARAR